MAAGKKTTDAQKAQFLENLKKCGVVRHAAAASGIGQRTAYDLRAADADFADAMPSPRATSAKVPGSGTNVTAVKVRV